MASGQDLTGFDAALTKQQNGNEMVVYFVYKKKEIVYIGQTVMTIPQRKGKSLSEARKGRGSVFGAAIRKHGEDSFRWAIIAEFQNQEECCRYEKEAIARHKPRYNQQSGGKKGFESWNKGQKETRPEVLKKISNAAKARISHKRGKYSVEGVANIRNAKLKSSARPFKCLENGKVYQNKVEASQDLGIPAGGISLVLMPTTRNKSFHGFHFEYLAQGKSSLIDLESPRGETGRKAKAAVND